MFGEYMKYHCVVRVLFVILLSLLFSSCATSPPKHLNDSCSIFEEKDDWYGSAKASYQKWGVPVAVQLAFIHQESGFRHDAKPPRAYLLGFIPWGRKSSAYGYGQVLDGTWDWYKRDTGNSWADRDDFDDVVDFIGWYGSQSHKKLGIAKHDAYNLYLSYHEGQGGYRRGSYRKKKWLLAVANKVKRRAARYRTQIRRCKSTLEKKRGWLF